MKKIIIKDELCEPGLSVNEDAIYTGDTYGIVLDGATCLTKKTLRNGENIARWYVQQIGEYIQVNLNDGNNTKTVLRDAITHAKNQMINLGEMSDDTAEQPSASFAMVRLEEDALELIILGDCNVVLQFGDNEFEVYGDDSLSKLDNMVIKHMVDLKNQTGESILEIRHYEEINEHLIINRRKKNTKNGYWTMGFDEEALEHAIYKKIPYEKIENIYLYSDGIAEYYEKMKLVSSVENFVKLAEQKGIRYIYDDLRKRQEDDKLGNLYPRFKLKDDASFLALQISNDKQK